MQRPGLTRVDFAVIFAVGVVLVGLLGVILARQRENGMRLQCMNNLRRIGEASIAFQEGKQGSEGAMKAGHGFLPPARLAEGYATWAVLLAPYLAGDSPLHHWELSKPYLAQDPAVREALITTYFCPARSRPAWLSTQGELDADGRHVPGALGDYAGVAGSGDPARSWDGPNADGLIILGEVLEWQGDEVLRWRGRTRLPDTEKDAKARGLSTTFLFGEKHVPPEAF